jgi:hypothetical protein
MRAGHRNPIFVIGMVSLTRWRFLYTHLEPSLPRQFSTAPRLVFVTGGRASIVRWRAEQIPAQKAYLVRGWHAQPGPVRRKPSRITRATHQATGIQSCTVPGSDLPNRFHPHWRKSPAAYVSPPTFLVLSRSLATAVPSVVLKSPLCESLLSPSGQQTCYQRRHI